MTLALSAHVAGWPGSTILTDASGARLGPWALERAFRTARGKVAGLPAGFRYHDLRHASAKTTLDTYGNTCSRIATSRQEPLSRQFSKIMRTVGGLARARRDVPAAQPL